MLVSPSYLHYLATGRVTPPSDNISCSPDIVEVRRSRWYDFLSAEDRAEAMRGIWGVMAWMLRAQE